MEWTCTVCGFINEGSGCFNCQTTRIRDLEAEVAERDKALSVALAGLTGRGKTIEDLRTRLEAAEKQRDMALQAMKLAGVDVAGSFVGQPTLKLADTEEARQ